MKQNNLGRFLFVILVVCWSLYEIYPPVSRDLVTEFTSQAESRNATFTNILNEVSSLRQANTNAAEFTLLQEAIGTNNIQPFFPAFDASAQLHPTTYILNELQRRASGRVKLGLDLQGGTSFLVSMNTNALLSANSTNHVDQSAEISSAISQAVEVLRKRVDAFGVAEPVIQPVGGNQILIQLPGLSQAAKDSAKEQIQKAAFLEFCMVKDDSDQILKNGDPIPPGYHVLKRIQPRANGQPPSVEEVVVKKTPENGLKGDIVKSAMVIRDQLGNPEISFTLTDDGAKKFATVTKENVGHRMAIILDGQLYSAPNINSPIETGNGEISGSFTIQEAQELANVLQNPLRAPLNIDSSEDVDPTLGKDSIHSGISSSIYAVVFVSLFMLLYYRVAGLAANIALVTNIIILLGVMCSIGTTLTLPGIAGVVLTIGMAVDANVLIYERLREELAKGKTLRGAIDAGYARAFGTIFDSHVTTLISSVILIFMGTGPIKGFGVTLTIGVAASLFTALVVTRLIFNFLLDKNLIKSLSMWHIIKATKVDFMKIATPLSLITTLFIVLSLGFGFTRGSKLFGVDFLGGDSTTFSFAHKVDVEKIRNALTAAGDKGAEIQYQKDVVGGLESLRITTSSGTADSVKQTLGQKFPEAHFLATSTKAVGATVGEAIRQSAVEASLMAMLGILVYVAFRYEFTFAIAAVLGVLHDVLFAIGAYCIANYISGREFNATVVAAILTIIGFSINDKIVVFDRIREDLKLGVRGSFKEIINQALNQTLSRTIITSGTVFLATMSLYIFGGGVINDFAFTFLVGIITGTYSSIYIASALVLRFHKGERPKIGNTAVAVQNAAPAKS